LPTSEGSGTALDSRSGHADMSDASNGYGDTAWDHRRSGVTGGAGFIGSHYVCTLLAAGYPGWADAEVTILGSHFPGRPRKYRH
jgi:hypothetical protein